LPIPLGEDLFQPDCQVEQTPGGYKVLNASGQALAYVYARETANKANIAGVLTFDEARLIAVNVGRARKAIAFAAGLRGTR